MAKQTCDPFQASLDWCEGTPVYAGMRRRVFYTSRSNIIGYPKVPADEIGRPTSAVLAGDFVMKEGAVFYYIDIVPERSQPTSTPQGEYPSQTSQDKIVLVHPGVGAKASAMAAYCHNADNVYVWQDIDGSARVIGIEDQWQTKSEVAQDFGQGPTGQPGTTLTVTGTNKVPFPEYVGKITTEDGEIDFSKN